MLKGEAEGLVIWLNVSAPSPNGHNEGSGIFTCFYKVPVYVPIRGLLWSAIWQKFVQLLALLTLKTINVSTNPNRHKAKQGT